MVFLLLAPLAFCFAQVQADDVIGTWFSEDKVGKIKIYKQDDKYYGKLVWRVDPTVLDDQNPDPALRSQPRVGLVILKEAIFDGIDTWEDGTIYDPANGRTYSAKMTMENKNTLFLRGYVVFSMLGRTSTWYRIEETENQ